MTVTVALRLVRWTALLFLAPLSLACSRPASPLEQSFRRLETLAAPHPGLAAVAQNSTLATPITSTTTVYAWQGDPTQRITSTVVTYPDLRGALAAYNGWLALYAFMPAVDHSGFAAGDQAELVDQGWPALHAFIGRRDNTLLLIESDEGMPADVRTAAMTDLAGRYLGP